MVRRERTRPSPAHSGQGDGMTWPVPAHVGQTRLDTTWPRKPRCTLCTSPRPEHVEQVAGWVPGAGRGGGGGGGGGGAGRGAAPGAHRAEDGGVDRDVLGDPEDRLVELELDGGERVPAGPGAAARPARRGPAEEGVHDVAQSAEAGAGEPAGPGTRGG